jgi:hypothetical protein
VPELGSLGTVRGALGNERPYREHGGLIGSFKASEVGSPLMADCVHCEPHIPAHRPARPPTGACAA